MEERIEELASVGNATASWNVGQLRIQAVGEVTESCWAVAIELSPLDIWPPEFAVVQRRTSPICADVMTRYLVAESFTFGTAPETIKLHHADGTLDVPVEGAADARAGGDFEEAEGRSRRRFVFDEAFTNAVEALPFAPSETPDQLDRVVVTEIRAELGGIAGSRDLVVRVRRDRAPD